MIAILPIMSRQPLFRDERRIEVIVLRSRGGALCCPDFPGFLKCFVEVSAGEEGLVEIVGCGAGFGEEILLERGEFGKGVGV